LDDEVEVAANNRRFDVGRSPAGAMVPSAQQCNGGYMSYCCSGYKQALIGGSPSNVVEAGRYEGISARSLGKRDLASRELEKGLWIIDGKQINPRDFGGPQIWGMLTYHDVG